MLKVKMYAGPWVHTLKSAVRGGRGQVKTGAAFRKQVGRFTAGIEQIHADQQRGAPDLGGARLEVRCDTRCATGPRSAALGALGAHTDPGRRLVTWHLTRRMRGPTPRYAAPAETLDSFQAFQDLCMRVTSMADVEELLFGTGPGCVTLSTVGVAVSDLLDETRRAFQGARNSGFGRHSAAGRPPVDQVVILAALYNLVGLRSEFCRRSHAPGPLPSVAGLGQLPSAAHHEDPLPLVAHPGSADPGSTDPAWVR